MNAVLNDVLLAHNLDELKAIGKYLELKKAIETKIDSKLGVNGWSSLFDRINCLKNLLTDNKDLLLSTYSQNSFTDAKNKLTKIVGFKIKAKSKKQLKSKIDNMIKLFCFTIFDPYKRFEETKIKNFKNSSKLEGIDIDDHSSTSLEKILAKHRR